MHRGNEAVASPGASLDVARCFGMIVERRTDLLDAGVQTVLKVNEGFLAPNLLPELLASDQLAGPPGEQDEDFGGLGRQVNLHPGFPEFATLGVYVEDTKAQQRMLPL